MLTRLDCGWSVRNLLLNLGEIFPNKQLELVRPNKTFYCQSNQKWSFSPIPCPEFLLLRLPALCLLVHSHHGEGLAEPHQAPQLAPLPSVGLIMTV